MTTAVLISGECRTLSRVLPSLHWQVFSRLENPHFFCSIAKDEDAGAIELLRSKYANVHIEVVEQPTLPEPPMSHTIHAPYAITPTRTPGVGPLQGIMRALWHYSRAWKFAQEHGAGDCDVFVRCRPDLHFHRFEMPRPGASKISNAMLNVQTSGRPIAANEAFACAWGSFGPGMNDRFAVMGKDAAKAFFETYDVLPELLASGSPFHPETLVGAAIERAGCVISRTLLAEFAFLRKSGELVHMQFLPQELAEWIAHLSKQ